MKAFVLLAVAVLGLSACEPGPQGPPGATVVGQPGAVGAPGTNGTPGRDASAVLTVSDFATLNGLVSGGKSTAVDQIDTLCVDLSTADLSALRLQLDELARLAGGTQELYYNKFKANDAAYVACINAGTDYVQCRAETSDVVGLEYANYLLAGGAPVLLPAKLKLSGCTAAAPTNGRLQSVHGSFLADFAARP